jgi:hypothetical protein
MGFGTAVSCFAFTQLAAIGDGKSGVASPSGLQHLYLRGPLPIARLAGNNSHPSGPPLAGDPLITNPIGRCPLSRFTTEAEATSHDRAARSAVRELLAAATASSDQR